MPEPGRRFTIIVLGEQEKSGSHKLFLLEQKNYKAYKSE